MMSTAHSETDALRDSFLGWQCRIRQMAVRQDDGRPMPAMVPNAFVGDTPLGPIVTLLVKRPSFSVTPEFRHMVKSTHDPRQRREKALKYLASAYYQRFREFDDQLTALFGPANAVAETLLAARTCRLVFEQFNQGFDLTCSVRALDAHEDAFETTFWHNHLFNPNLPDGVRILGFEPDWTASSGGA